MRIKSVVQKGICVFLLLLLMVGKAPRVQAVWYDEDSAKCNWFAISKIGMCLFGNIAASFRAMLTDVIQMGVGNVPGITLPADVDPNNPEVQSMQQKSLIAAQDKVIMAMYQYPASSTTEGLADLGRTFGVLPHVAYAQGPGIGFSGLAPLLPLWKVFRNISYFLIAVIMVVIGFMVMFRKKIDPKTVVTVQNAIPGVIVTLLLITFSYTIVGFMIDLMYLLISLILAMLIPVGNSLAAGTFDGDTATKYLNAHWANAIGMIFNAGLRTTDDILGFMGAGGIGTSITVGGIGALLVGLFTPAGAPVAIGVGIAIGILPVLLVAIAIIFAVFRILFMLLNSYINIIISLLTAPLQLLMGAIPGNHAFSSWFMNLVSNLLAFPITAAFLLIATILAKYESFVPGTPIVRLWAPPFIGGGTRGVSGLIALGLLFSIPSIVNGIKESLKAKPPVAAGPGAVLGPLGSGIGTGVQLVYQGAFIRSAFHKPPPPSTPVGRVMEAAESGTGGVAKKIANE